MRKRILIRKRPRLVLTALVMAALLVPIAGASAAPPANDELASPVVVGALPFTNVQLTNEATGAVSDPNCFGGGRTVWYSFTAPGTARVSVDTLESNYDTTLGVYTGDPAALIEIACNDNSADYNRQSRVRFDAVAGTTYHVMVGSLATGTRGTLRLAVQETAAAATNDETPKVVEALPFAETVDASGGTAGPGDPNCYEAGHTLWYSFSPGQDMPLLARTGESGWDTVVGVYEQSGESLDRIACTDYPDVLFKAKAGSTYLIMVGSYYGSFADELTFSLEEGPEVLDVEARIAREGQVRDITGAARVEVGVRCSDQAKAWISGTVKQRQGSRIVKVRFSKRVDCLEKWSDTKVTAVPDSRAFRTGRAIVDLRVNASVDDRSGATKAHRIVVLQ
jgi:hypothetical protein